MYTRSLIFIFFIAANLYSQNVGTYMFTNSTGTFGLPAGTTFYTINGGGGSTDNGYSLPVTIPFPFNFGGTDFTQYVMCSNGYFAFGTSLTASEYSAFYNTWSGTRNNIVCFAARDLFADGGTFYGYETEGTAPNRVHKILCLGLRPPGITQKGNCQINLYEGTNRIEIIYSAFPTTWTGTCFVGLRGGSSGSNDLRTLLGTGTTAWTSPLAGNTNTATMNQQSPVNPDNNRMYTFFYDPTPMTYVTSTVTQGLTTGLYPGAPRQRIIGVEVVTAGYSSPLSLTGLTLNTDGSTNPAGDILNAKVYSTGTVGSFSTSSQFGTAYISPNGSFVINGSVALENGTNYFWVTYDISSSAVPGDIVDAECNLLTLSGSGGTQVPSVQSPAGSRQILPTLSSVNVGTGQTYTSLTNPGGLFEAINSTALFIAANLTVNITSSLTETGTFALNDMQTQYSVTIVPSAGVERVISGANSTTALITLSGADNLTFDGRFGGSGKFLRFRNLNATKPTIQFINDSRRNTIRDCYIESNNTQTSSGQGIILFGTTTGTNGNDSNTLMNCDIRNRSDLAGNPVYGIVCMGNPAGTLTFNSDNIITGCNIYNFNSASSTYGVYLSTGTGSNWRIENNSFYNTASISSQLWYAIYHSSLTEGNQQILNNYIGGSAPNCGGSALAGNLVTLSGIFFRGGINTTSTISGNTIKNINVTKTANSGALDGLIGIYAARSSYIITNNILGDTSSNNNVAITGGSGIYMNGLFIAVDSVNTLNLSSNTAGSVSLNLAGGAYFTVISSYEVEASGSTKQIINNKIGSITVPNSIQTNSPSACSITCIDVNSYYGTSLLNVSGNMVANITNTLPNNASDQLKGINGSFSYSNDAVCNVTGNLVYNLNSPYPWGISFAMYDGNVYAGGTAIGYFNVKNNTVKGINSTGSSTFNAVFGLYLFTKADHNDVSSNKVSNLSNSQASGFIGGLFVRSEYFWPGRWPYEKNLVYNNQVSITNGEATARNTSGNETDAFTNSQNIIGIDIDHGDSARVYNNSVYIGGVNGGSQKSECLRFEFYTGANTNPDVRNNLLVNNRTGSGDHLAVTVEKPDSNFVAGSFNYNTYITSDVNKVCQWYESSNKSFEGWKDSCKGDKQSWSVGTTQVNPQNLFVDAAGGNLNINYNNAEAWIVSGKGMPLSYVSADHEGNIRHTSVLYNYPTDIGSDEFSQTPPGNPTAAETGTPGPGNTTTYKLFGRIIMQVDWAPGGSSYPTGLNVKYYSSVEPPAITGGYGYSYWNVTPNGTLSGAAYDITVNFGENETHSITSPSINTRLAKKDAGWVAYTEAGTGTLQSELDWDNRNVKVRGIESFSDFALIDFSNPLPVNICSFDAGAVSRDVILDWQTCSELNNAGFDIERRAQDPKTKEFSAWQKTGFVAGSGTTAEVKNYRYEDKKLSTGKYQYRLKQIDFNGSFEYYLLNSPDIIEVGKPISFEMSQNYPNPSNPSSKIDYQIPFSGKVNLVIYDMLGREVEKLVNNEVKEAGYYTSEFNGSALASGIYFYRIVTEGDGGKFIKTLKLVLVK